MTEPYQPPPQFSPDGRFYWDGQQWVPVQAPATPQYGTRSPDRQHWWDGAQWQPIAPSPAPVPSAFQAPQATAAPQGPTQGVKRTGHMVRDIVLVLVGLIVLIVVISAYAGANLARTSTPTGHQASVNPEASAAADATVALQRYKTVRQSEYDMLVGALKSAADCSQSGVTPDFCRADYQSVVTRTQNMLTDLKPIAVPTCLTQSDTEMHHALDLLAQAYGVAVQAADAYKSGQTDRSTTLLTQATGYQNQATDALSHSQTLEANASCPK